MSCRTSNKSEKAVIEYLEREGYTVLKRSWPDLLAAKGDLVRFIEVKKDKNKKGKPANQSLKPQQVEVAEILSRIGIEVEIIRA